MCECVYVRECVCDRESVCERERECVRERDIECACEEECVCEREEDLCQTKCKQRKGFRVKIVFSRSRKRGRTSNKMN